MTKMRSATSSASSASLVAISVAEFCWRAADRRDDIGARADVDALERLVEQQQAARLGLPARQHDLLLVAAGQLLQRVVRPARADAEAGDGLLRGLRARGWLHDAVAEPFLEMREGDRAGDSAGQRGRRQSANSPSDPRRPCRHRRRSIATGPLLCQLRPSELHLAAGEILKPEEAAQQPALAGAERAGDRRRPRLALHRGRTALSCGISLHLLQDSVTARRTLAAPAGIAASSGRPIMAPTAAWKSIGLENSPTTRPPRSTTARSAMRARSPSRCEI